MLISAQDIFWIVLSFAILWIGLCLGWAVYYLAMILRDVKKTTVGFRKKMDLIDQILEILKKKIDSTANYLPPLIEGAGKLVQHFHGKKKKK